ncbi:hypothetical protein HRbin27_00347 [bacterium HR27]|nr:hypothetical protein HRbin27_00347 [bacterium HR27]
MRVRQLGNLPNRLHSSGHVRRMTHHDQTRIRTQRPPDVVRVHDPGRPDPDHRGRDTDDLQRAQRTPYCSVFERGRHRMIT